MIDSLNKNNNKLNKFLCLLVAFNFFTLWGSPAHWWAGRSKEFLNRQAAMRHGSQHIYVILTLVMLVWPTLWTSLFGICQI